LFEVKVIDIALVAVTFCLVCAVRLSDSLSLSHGAIMLWSAGPLEDVCGRRVEAKLGSMALGYFESLPGPNLSIQ
jgi:hypothetical protein